jgi:hypothetical protein
MFVDTIKFVALVQNLSKRWWGCSYVGSYNGSGINISKVFDWLKHVGNTMVVCTYNFRRMSSSCFGSQHGTQAEWMCKFEVSVYYVMWGVLV